MLKIAIEKAIPIPLQQPKNRRYPFGDLEIGDSFFVECPDPENMRKLANSIGGAAAAYRKRHGGAFTIRSATDGIRVWRTEVVEQ